MGNPEVSDLQSGTGMYVLDPESDCHIGPSLHLNYCVFTINWLQPDPFNLCPGVCYCNTSLSRVAWVAQVIVYASLSSQR